MRKSQVSSLLHFQATPQPNVTHALVGSDKVAIYSGSVHHGHGLPKEAMSQCEAWCWLLDMVVEMITHSRTAPNKREPASNWKVTQIAVAINLSLALSHANRQRVSARNI